jgi:cytidylate kinase
VAFSDEALLIGGRSGVAKSAVAAEVSAQLAAAFVAHVVIDGDFLDLAYPPPSDVHLAERNLTAIWMNYRNLGYRRLIYANTACILSAGRIAAAMGGKVRVLPVLLTCSDDAAASRLARREIGSTLKEHLQRSRTAAVHLERAAPPGTVRIETTTASLATTAELVISAAGWTRQDSMNNPVTPDAFDR